MADVQKIGSRWIRLSAIAMVEETATKLVVSFVGGQTAELTGDDAAALREKLENSSLPEIPFGPRKI